MAKKKVVPTTPKTPPVLPDDPEELRALALKLHADLEEAKERRKSDAQLIVKQQESINLIYDVKELSRREREEYQLRIRRNWRCSVDELRHAANRFLGSWPSIADTCLFEDDDWERGREMVQKLRRVIDEWDRFQFESTSMVINASSRFAIVKVEEEGESSDGQTEENGIS